MTEAEWDACADPAPMLKFLRGRMSERKLRLFACACCRRIWRLLADERSRAAVEAAERFADGQATSEEGARARAAADAVAAAVDQLDDTPRAADAVVLATNSASAAATAAVDFFDPFRDASRACAAAAAAQANVRAHGRTQVEWHASRAAECAAQSFLLRDLFGNPFRPVVLDIAWLAFHARAVRKLAHAINTDRDFGKLPLLADALEEGGCTDAAILAHCRGAGEHVRGCWVVDLVRSVD